MKEPTGKISLTFRKKADDKTYLARQYFKLPLQIMMPHYYDIDGTAFVYLLNPGGGILQHDRLFTEIISEPESSAVVTTPSNTKFYKMDDGHAEVINELHVKDGGILEYLPEHNVPFAEAKAYQENIFRVEGNGVLFASDMVTAGRVSRDELFQYDIYSSRTKIYIDGTLQLLDHTVIEPKKGGFDGMGILEGYQSNGSFYAYAKGMSPELAKEINEMDTGVFLAAGNVIPDLLVVRFLGDNIIDMQKTMLTVWDICRKSILGKPGVRIRKY